MLRGDELEVEIGDDRVVLLRYPFLRGRNEGRSLAASELCEVLPSWAPPCVRTRPDHAMGDELLFVPATEREALVAFAVRNGIPSAERIDLWSLILDPFLDTEHSAAILARGLDQLAAHGVPSDEVARIRALVGRRMNLLTVLSWEWSHYGLFDVLDAMLTFTWTTGWSFRRFYWYAMELALRG